MVLNTLIIQDLLLLPTQIHTLPKLIHRHFITSMVLCLILVLWIMPTVPHHHFITTMVLCPLLVHRLIILMITNTNTNLTLILLSNPHFSPTLALPPIPHPLNTLLDLMIISDPLPHLFTLLFMTLWVLSPFLLIITHHLQTPAPTMDNNLITPSQVILICLIRAGLIPHSHIAPVCRLFPLVNPP